MRRNNCPVCGTPVSYWRQQREQSWRLQNVGGPFRCQICATMLQWSIGRWHWLGNALLVGALVAMNYHFIMGRLPDAKVLIGMCLGMAAVMLVVGFFARRLVIHSDE